MSYHRGGHPGAVAVSFSTSTMAPLSPTRRYSGSTGTSVTSGTNGSATSKYTSYRSSGSSTSGSLAGERNGSYYSSSSNAGYRSGSFTSSGSSDIFKRTYYSPARSVASYNETNSVGGSSLNGSGLGRYGSASSSSASSTTSSNSSSSRDRTNYQNQPSAGSLATTVADLYAIYSPTNYVPNISSATSKGNNKNWPQTPAASNNSEDCENSRDRRSYSVESNATGSSDRWSTRRDGKRRVPTPVNGRTGIAHQPIGNGLKRDSSASPIEVTSVNAPVKIDKDTVVNVKSSLKRDESNDVEKNSSSYGNTKNGHDTPDDIDASLFTDNRDFDNNNGPMLSPIRASIDRDCRTKTCDLDSRRRKKCLDDKVPSDDFSMFNGHAKTETPGDVDRVLEYHNRDDNNISESTWNFIGNDHHHQSRNNDNFAHRENENDSIRFPSLKDPCDTKFFNDSNVTSLHLSTLNDDITEKDNNRDFQAMGKVEIKVSRIKASLDDSGSKILNEDCIDFGDTGGGDSAAAYTRTKITTNDNTDLLTNNHRDSNDGNVDKASNSVDNDDADDGSSSKKKMDEVKTRIRVKTTTSVTRKSLKWTATSPIDDDEPINGKNDSNVDHKATNGNGDENDDCDDGKNIFFEDKNDVWGGRDDDADGTSPLLKNGVKPLGNRSDESEKSSRRILFGWNDPTIDDPTVASSSSSSSAANDSTPAAVHQNSHRSINDPIDESSSSRPPRSRIQSRRDERYGLNGLRNIGNTCFMNSVIQCLSNTRPLLEYLLNEQHLHDINTTTSSMKGALIKAFGQMIHELWEVSGDHVVNTTAFKTQIQRFAPRFMGYSQQDAQEFLRYLLEGLHEDVNRVTVKPQPILTDIPDHYSDGHKASESWKRYLRSEDSTIVDVFVGQLRSSLHCTSCDHVSVTLDPFWDLSLPIPSRSGTVKLNQCLEHFTKVETLDGDEKPTCSKCQMRRKCTKSFSIQKFPKILVIHLKRFSPTERFRGKLSVLVDFPLNSLDLSAFAAPGVQGPTYNLYGVANHSGTTYSGHYTAYCKHPYSSDWHEYNDNRVSTVPARSVASSEAYVLFYEQQTPNPHL